MKVVLGLIVGVVALPVLLFGFLVGAYGAAQPDTPSCDAPSACAGPTGPVPPFTGPDGLVDDPTTSGRITRRMLHTYNAVQAAFHGWKWGITCWDAHAWNPTSDHPRGRACDFAVGRIGLRPDPALRSVGWQLARWARLHASALGISYVIWDGHIWSQQHADEAWRRYHGGGVYNPASITGGHFDHVHLSVAPDQSVPNLRLSLGR